MSSNALATQDSLRIASFETQEEATFWRVVNDSIMGGRSTSEVSINNNCLTYRGELITDGGGFASLRGQNDDWDFSEYATVRIKVLGDGRHYKFRFLVKEDRASYQHEFGTTPGQWQIIEMQFDDFYASWRGRRVDRPPLNADSITGMGLILADGNDGKFHIALDWIALDQAPGDFKQ